MGLSVSTFESVSIRGTGEMNENLLLTEKVTRLETEKSELKAKICELGNDALRLGNKKCRYRLGRGLLKIILEIKLEIWRQCD